MEDFYDLLAGCNALEDLLTHRAFLDLGDELLRHREVNIRIEQRQSHLTQGVGDIRLGEPSVTTKVLEGLLKLIGEVGKHWDR